MLVTGLKIKLRALDSKVLHRGIFLWLEQDYVCALKAAGLARLQAADCLHALLSTLKLLQESPRVFSQLLGVPKLLDVIKANYWTLAGPDSDKLPAGGGKLSEAEIVELRRAVLHTTRILMQHSILSGTWRSERSWADIQVADFSVLNVKVSTEATIPLPRPYLGGSELFERLYRLNSSAISEELRVP